MGAKGADVNLTRFLVPYEGRVLQARNRQRRFLAEQAMDGGTYTRVASLIIDQALVDEESPA